MHGQHYPRYLYCCTTTTYLNRISDERPPNATSTSRACHPSSSCATKTTMLPAKDREQRSDTKRRFIHLAQHSSWAKPRGSTCGTGMEGASLLPYCGLLTGRSSPPQPNTTHPGQTKASFSHYWRRQRRCPTLPRMPPPSRQAHSTVPPAPPRRPFARPCSEVLSSISTSDPSSIEMRR